MNLRLYRLIEGRSHPSFARTREEVACRFDLYQRVNDWLIAHTPKLIVAVLVVLVLV